MEKTDYLILGAGWGGLTAASLLAKAGHEVTVLEAQDRAGGCGQSFTIDGFSFCAEMQYLMGCGPGGVVHDWLVALGLERDVEFNPLDPDGYDRIELPGFRFSFPHDARRLEAALKQAFPGETDGIDQLFEVLLEIRREISGPAVDVRHFLANPFQYKTTALYGPWSASRVFDHFELSPQLQAVLAGQCGDIGLGPRDEPFFCLASLLLGYSESAHFPKRGMGHFVDRVVDFIGRHGGEIHFGARVTGIASDDDQVTTVETSRGSFRASRVVSNIDPATTMAMIDGATVPHYEQSASCFTVFLGLDIDLGAHGFGRFNVWDFPDVDLDAVIDRTMNGHSYEDPFFFLSTPSLYADPGVLAPPGCTTVQIDVASSYDYFEEAEQRGAHDSERQRVTEEIVRAVQRRRVPGLAGHIVVREAWSPLDLSRRTGLARGGMYGARLDFINRVIRRVPQRTDYANLFLTGATAGGPGLQGVVSASTRLVEKLLTADKADESVS